MPRYFIRTANGIAVEDEEGVELFDHEPLHAMLRETLTAILHDETPIDGAAERSARAYHEDGKLVMQSRASINIRDQ
ncbi:DUF6894 family protein [Methylobacterium phyllosphaerae]